VRPERYGERLCLLTIPSSPKRQVCSNTSALTAQRCEATICRHGGSQMDRTTRELATLTAASVLACGAAYAIGQTVAFFVFAAMSCVIGAITLASRER
jgi:hypothetical protein